MKNFIEQNIFVRFVIPIIAIIGSLFFVICGTGLYQFISDGKVDSLISFGVFMILFVILMVPSLFFYKDDNYKDVTDIN